MSGDQSACDSLPTSSPKGTCTFEGPSDADVEAQRRAEDRHFVCSIGGKSNRRRADFLVHFRTHTGEKAYGCDMCDKVWTMQGNLNTHGRTDTGEKLYACVRCARYEMFSGQI
ncbi:hypothetical protein AVEN_41703-1 [Araneus ventricosus]|uniref:C2H2-type domain-containing protein n=1 Tax=Araneus ventricosus TaxID=182803 RepID=A0A4Y2SGM5_ARAVE|nr:hypothetical protein AVEN_41703-1 [Araneus ventricosus]